MPTAKIVYFVCSFPVDADPELRCTLYARRDDTGVIVVGQAQAAIGDSMADTLQSAGSDAGVDIGL